MPKGKKHTPEQIVAILRRVEQGEAAEAVCRNVNISEATLYRWKRQYGAMELDEVKELKALREENDRLKRLVADQALNIQVLKEVNSKNGEPVAAPPRRPERGCGGRVFAAAGVPLSGLGAFEPRVPAKAAGRAADASRGGDRGGIAAPSSIWISARACPDRATGLWLRSADAAGMPLGPAAFQVSGGNDRQQPSRPHRAQPHPGVEDGPPHPAGRVALAKSQGGAADNKRQSQTLALCVPEPPGAEP